MARVEDSPFLLTAGGTETYLAFTQGFDLRDMCAFEVFEDEAALTKLEERCLAPILESAARQGFDLLLDTMTWRAQPDWVAALGYPTGDVERFNRLAVERTRDFVTRWMVGRELGSSIFINGDIGPRQDGYRVDRVMSVEEAQRYHGRQIAALAAAGVDVINALTMTYANEAAGIARAARDARLPCIVSPTIETDGTTPDGTPLGDFVDAVDVATGGSPLFYMVNCAHPIHLEPVLQQARSDGARWLARFRGFRANASRKSHAELDESTQLDRGYPEALSSQLAHLQADFSLRLLGGCCGTDHEHIRHIADAVRETARQAAP